ncbi:hypothetical protein ACP4OV_004245 [Aristida adscensionis]
MASLGTPHGPPRCRRASICGGFSAPPARATHAWISPMQSKK